MIITFNARIKIAIVLSYSLILLPQSDIFLILFQRIEPRWENDSAMEIKTNNEKLEMVGASGFEPPAL